MNLQKLRKDTTTERFTSISQQGKLKANKLHKR